MTKCIVLGENELVGKAPIQLKYCMVTDSDHATNEGDDHGCDILPTSTDPSEYDSIELIVKCYTSTDGHYYDLMFGYNKSNRSAGTLYLGYWNDGIV